MCRGMWGPVAFKRTTDAPLVGEVTVRCGTLARQGDEDQYRAKGRGRAKPRLSGDFLPRQAAVGTARARSIAALNPPASAADAP